MIEAKVDYDSDEKPIAYPGIGVSEDAVVLFDKPGYGVVLQSDDYAIGYYSTTWKMDAFAVFRGTISLSNK